MAFEVRIPISAGHVSAIYFVLFDVVVLSMVDIVMARILSRYYYYSIYHGRVVTLRSADIPGVTTYLLDAFWSWPNIIARFIKIAIIICVLIVDININSAFARPSSEISRTARYQFNASQEAWGDSIEDINFVAVGFTWDKIRTCYERSEQSDELRYYSVAFDLEFNITIDPDGTINAPPNMTDIHRPDVLDNTTQCLSPDLVADDFVVPTVHVIGCSELNRTSDCRAEAPLEGSASICEECGAKFFGHGNYTGEIFSAVNASLIGDWARYPQPELTCITFRIGVVQPESFFSPCLLYSVLDDGNTLIEFWIRDTVTGIYRRTFPGPVFKGVLSIGTQKRIDALFDSFSHWKSGLRWDTLSGILVANGNIYKRDQKNITVYGERKTVTSLPGYSVILLFIVVLSTILTRIVIHFKVNDSRPQLNTIDGLSSIAREESQPTGRSLTSGATLTVGFKNVPKGIRFGPIRDSAEVIVRDPKQNITIL